MDKYPDMGEVTGLRLELGRMTDKANALEAALRKEVAVVIADAIKDAAKSVAENDRLKQDNVRLSAQVVGLQVNAVNDPSLRSAFLKAVHKDYDDIKAEVERLRASSFVTAVPSEEYERSTAQYNGIIDTQLKVIDELKAEVERLTAEVNYRKDMDTHIKIMADQYTPAKEGKPHA